MNTYTKMVGLLVLVLSAVKLQAYTFTIKNLTEKPHYVAIQLKGSQKPSESKMVEMYGPKPSLFAQAKSAVQGWVKDLANSWSDTFDSLILDANSAITVDAMKKQLSTVQADIERKIKEGALKVGAKQWVQDLNSLKNKMQKGMSQLDRQQLAQNLSALQTKIKRDIADVSNPKETPLDTAVFEFGGIRCVSKILVDGNPVSIYGVPGKQYDALQTIFDRGPGVHRMEFLGKITDNITNGNYTDMTKTLFGICFSRQFDIVDLGDRLVIITREKI